MKPEIFSGHSLHSSIFGQPQFLILATPMVQSTICYQFYAQQLA